MIANDTKNGDKENNLFSNFYCQLLISVDLQLYVIVIHINTYKWTMYVHRGQLFRMLIQFFNKVWVGWGDGTIF